MRLCSIHALPKFWKSQQNGGYRSDQRMDAYAPTDIGIAPSRQSSMLRRSAAHPLCRHVDPVAMLRMVCLSGRQSSGCTRSGRICS